MYLSTSCLSLTDLPSNLNRLKGVRITYLTRNSGVLRLLAERKNEVGRYLIKIRLLEPPQKEFGVSFDQGKVARVEICHFEIHNLGFATSDLGVNITGEYSPFARKHLF